MRLIPAILFLLIAVSPALGQTPKPVLWSNPLDASADLAGDGNGTLARRGQRTALQITRTTLESSTLRTFTIPPEKIRGQWIYLSADILAEKVSDKPADWNGIKVMLKIDTPSATLWPQIALPVGSFDWQRRSVRILVPKDATALTLHVGLEKVSGTVWLDDLRITQAKVTRDVPAAPADQPLFKGHSLEALRGAMVHPRITKADLTAFAKDWNGNVIRYQLFRLPKPGTEQDLAAYDRWLDGELKYLDQVLVWAKDLGVLVVIDLHSPPGGPIGGGGAVGATGAFWTSPEAQAHFVKTWQTIAARYKKTPGIWGFDLLNEPDDRAVTENADDWQTLARRAAVAIREIDPERTLIVEPPLFGSAEGFLGFEPLALSRIVYSFHMYAPFEYTHQGVMDNLPKATYPGRVKDQKWDKAALDASMQPALDFAKQYRVHLYVGEFSAARWAPGADQYLADLTAVFEAHHFDWTYHAYREWHGWNLELGGDKSEEKAPAPDNPRQQAVRHWLQKNQHPQ